MKKLWKIFLLLIIGISLMGCATKKKIPDAVFLADSIKEKCEFSDELSELDENMIESIYALPEGVLKMRVYISTGATSEEIAVFEGKDGSIADKIETAVEKRIEEQKEGFSDYLPDETKKLDDAIIKREGNTVIFCVSPNGENAKQAIESLLKAD